MTRSASARNRNKELIEQTIQTNKDHQAALRHYAERLELELAAADSMIAAMAIDYEDADTENSGLISVAGATRPVPFALSKALHSEDSPFFADARWKKHYDDITTVNQPKIKDDDALREAVRIENVRKHALESQLRHQRSTISLVSHGHHEQSTEDPDWRRVAIKVNSTSGVTSSRSAEELEIRWKGFLCPSINHEPWSAEEVEKLLTIIAAEPRPVRWTKVAKALGNNRTPIECMRNAAPRKVHSWNNEADKQLLEAVEIYGINNWQLVAANVSEDATGAQCQKRFLDSIDPDIVGGPWSTDEDEKLMQAVAAFTTVSKCSSSSKSARKAKTGISWPDVALFVPGRTNNQCRERYERLSGIRKRKPTQGRTVKGKEKETDSLGDGTRDTSPMDSIQTTPAGATAFEADRRKRKPSATHSDTRNSAEHVLGKKRKVGWPRKTAQPDTTQVSTDGDPQTSSAYMPNMLPATLSLAEGEGSRRRSSRLAPRS